MRSCLDHGQLVRFSFFVDPEHSRQKTRKTTTEPRKTLGLEDDVQFGHGCEFSAG